MRDALGGSLLLNLVVIFVSIVILFFVGIITYSKAYKVKNRIVEVIEKYEKYDETVEEELNEELRNVGYIIATEGQVSSKCKEGNLNKSEYLYCVYLKSCSEYEDNDSTKSCIGERIYEVVAYTRFEFPLIRELSTFAVKGQTKTLGRVYNY